MLAAKKTKPRPKAALPGNGVNYAPTIRGLMDVLGQKYKMSKNPLSVPAHFINYTWPHLVSVNHIIRYSYVPG